MLYRVLSLLLVAFALALVVCPGVQADDKDKKADTHEGIVVKAGEGKLTMTDKEGKKEHTHLVPKDTKITCDGKECKLDDLKKGFPVKVTTEKRAATTGEKDVAVKIEAKSK